MHTEHYISHTSHISETPCCTMSDRGHREKKKPPKLLRNSFIEYTVDIFERENFYDFCESSSMHENIPCKALTDVAMNISIEGHSQKISMNNYTNRHS